MRGWLNHQRTTQRGADYGTTEVAGEMDSLAEETGKMNCQEGSCFGSEADTRKQSRIIHRGLAASHKIEETKGTLHKPYSDAPNITIMSDAP